MDGLIGVSRCVAAIAVEIVAFARASGGEVAANGAFDGADGALGAAHGADGTANAAFGGAAIATGERSEMLSDMRDATTLSIASS